MQNINLRFIDRLINFIIVIFLIPTFSFAQEKGINFIKPKNWEEVLSLAKAQHKNIFVDAFTTWCGPCRAMDQRVYPDTALGALMNKDFIAVRMQMDTTKNDDAYVKSWYAEAAKTMKNANIQAYPTLLFYNTEGTILVNTFGYKDVSAMITLAKFSSDPNNAALFNKNLAAFKSGSRDYSNMIALSRTVRQVLMDDKLALQIAKEYKTGYLDNADMNTFYTKENLTFIHEYGASLVDLNDKFFQLCYSQPEKIDTLLGKGAAKMYVSILISQELIQGKLYRDNEVITKKPNWKEISDNIRTRYPKFNSEELILDEKAGFYLRLKDWNLYTYFLNAKIKINPPQSGTLQSFYTLNDPAWNVFKHTGDKAALERALSWSNLSIELDNDIQYYDTKANILYRLGRKAEAIKVQRLAVKKNEELSKKDGKNWFPDYQENLDKMLKGQPTWPTN